MSVMIRSKVSEANSAKARSPELASSTRWPSRVRNSRTRTRMLSSSSTTRTRRLPPGAAAVLVDEAVADREAQAGALAGLLRREEGVEEAALDIGGEAEAVVGD